MSAPSAPSPVYSAYSPEAAPFGEMGADLAALLPGLRVVSGNPDEHELAAVMAVGMAATEALISENPAPAPDPAAEWRTRSRCGVRRSGKVAGTSSDAWRWSLHP